MNIIVGCPCVVNDEAVINSCVESLSAVFGDTVQRSVGKGSGSEDFSYVAAKVPSVMMVISAGSVDEGYCLPVHHPMATFNEDIMAKGVAAYAIAALGWLKKIATNQTQDER